MTEDEMLPDVKLMPSAAGQFASTASRTGAARSYGRYLVRRSARALFVAIVLALLVPLIMIHLFNLQAPELYPLEPYPYSYDYIRF
jgi:hypothetical protein